MVGLCAPSESVGGGCNSVLFLLRFSSAIYQSQVYSVQGNEQKQQIWNHRCWERAHGLFLPLP